MLDQALRTAILNLRAKGHGMRQIARALQISRGTVRTVLTVGSPMVRRMERAEKAEPHPEWQAFLGNKALVEALLSRLRHQRHKIRIDGPSLHKPQC